ncbi:nucleotide disphospho-sugar-binding domain-containing protein [Actinokineospora enzanensis]|uniref:nucleotide disphospho-sugar-binding domain-containing protein n=1 Tax=Actinokineospora enzanensis TaxID=155975 RepID=UPI000365211C|nr:nucleotide disphospho-sugar-binding domain-containing protein [Actinokineospora enzanensis]
MRVLFATFAWRSHYYPLVPLAWALANDGHDVRVACQPSLAGVVAETGLSPVVTGQDVDMGALARRDIDSGPRASGSMRQFRDAKEQTAALALTRFRTIAEAMADDLVSYARAWRPDLVVYEPIAYAGALAAELLGVPAVRHTWGVDSVATFQAMEAEVLRPLWRRFGLDEVGTLQDLVVDPCPPDLQLPFDVVDRGAPIQPMRYVPYNGSAVLPDWLLAEPERPRVCVTWGTSMPAITGSLALAEQALAAAARTDAEVVLAILDSHRARLGELPEGVRVAESLPLHAVLRHCSAVVHQGGAGTTLTAVTTGTPQIIVPTMGDQFMNAERIATGGAGLYLEQQDLGPDLLVESLDKVLTDPAYRAATAGIADRNAAQPTPAHVAGVLARLVTDREQT